MNIFLNAQDERRAWTDTINELKYEIIDTTVMDTVFAGSTEEEEL